MKKDLALIGGLLLLVLALLIFGQGFSSAGFAKKTNKQKVVATGSAVISTVRINESVFNVQIADTQDEASKGLSGRSSLPINEGLLFVFEKEEIYPIWMKEMQFPIDIIWIDSNKNIVDIEENALPEPGKVDRDLKIYTPDTASRYILEINAGISALNGFKIGDQVVF